MMGVGFGEMLMIAGIALIVIGPEKFPEFAKIVLKTVRDVRGYVDDVKTEIKKEMAPVKKEVDQLSRYKPEEILEAMAEKPGDNPSEFAAPTPPEEASPAAGPAGESAAPSPSACDETAGGGAGAESSTPPQEASSATTAAPDNDPSKTPERLDG